MTGTPAFPGHECYESGPRHGSTPGPYCAPLRCYCPGRPAEVPRGPRTTVDGEPIFLPRRPRPAGTYAGMVEVALDRPRVDVGLDHPAESHAAAAKALRSSRSLRAEVLALVAVRGEDGATSDEVEQRTGRAHQSISATLYGLEKDGLAVRSGPVRPTRYANDARAYVATPYGRSELSRLNVLRPSW